MWEDYKRPGWRGWLLPVGILLTAGVQVHILQNYSDQGIWLIPLIVIGSFIALTILVIERIQPFAEDGLIPGTVVITLLILLLSPLLWDVISLQNNDGSAWLPQAGPTQSSGQANNGGGPGGGNFQGPGGGFGGGNSGPGRGGNGFGRGGGGANFGGQGALTYAGENWDVLDAGLVSYLEANQGNARYLVATETSSYASIFILATNQPAMALGGYQGWDEILSPAQLAKLVDQGVIRFFYLSASGGQNSFASGSSTGSSAVNNDLVQWVESACKTVSAQLWQTNANGSTNFGRGGSQQLYDCAGHS
jgi:4-amino-4-deoxy-L-arabinose transferase-like glycosyltransferase